MPRKPKYSQETLVDTALSLIREGGYYAVTARSLGKRLGTAPATVFTHFDSIDDIRKAAIAKACTLFLDYIQKGLSLSMPAKGFAMGYIQFALDEPELFRLLFMSQECETWNQTFIFGEGYHNTVMNALKETFHVDEKGADWLYHSLWIYSHGLASLCAINSCQISQEEIAKMIGTATRGMLMSIQLSAKTGS